MNVILLSHTPNALELLLRTKNTRLRYESDPATWSDAQRAEHLAYMRDTIRSSWEFVDYVFEITGVTRAFTHQLVRTRTGAYAQESQRTVDVRESPVLMPASVAEKYGKDWGETVGMIMTDYATMIDLGIPAQDARGILPTNMTTSIIAKYSLRALSDMAKVRLCTRTQGEYQDVFRLMRARVIEVHPWVEEHRFIEVACVADARCAFPRYGSKIMPHDYIAAKGGEYDQRKQKYQCKFYEPWMEVPQGLRDVHRKVFWFEQKQIAVPIAKNGRTM